MLGEQNSNLVLVVLGKTSFCLNSTLKEIKQMVSNLGPWLFDNSLLTLDEQKINKIGMSNKNCRVVLL